jgi:3-oxoadipate enol-lactonase
MQNTLYPAVHTPIDTFQITSFDGTRIAVYYAGRGKKTMILAPGLGSNLYCWKYIIEHFADEWRMITWDPRGTYDSGWPQNPDRTMLEDHVGDMEVIVKLEKLKSFPVMGWSMGVQLSLEYYHRHPNDVESLVLINGAFEHVLSSVLGLPAIEPLLKGALKIGISSRRVVQPALKALMRHPLFPDLLSSLGLLSGTPDIFDDIVQKFTENDYSQFFTLLLNLHEHSARPYLSSIKVPTLVTAGTKDLLTPVSSGKYLASAIPGAKLMLIPGGTHYSMVEYPELILKEISHFYAVHNQTRVMRSRSKAGE